MNSDEQRESAERRISAILAELERDTGSVVRSICVRDIDITKMNDERRQWMRSVDIEIERLPGTRWA